MDVVDYILTNGVKFLNHKADAVVDEPLWRGPMTGGRVVTSINESNYVDPYIVKVLQNGPDEETTKRWKRTYDKFLKTNNRKYALHPLIVDFLNNLE